MKKSVYLSGPVELSRDPATWRNYVKKQLYEQYNVITPFGEFCPYSKDDQRYKDWIKEHFIIPDMNNVLISEYFCVKLDKDLSAGTYGELTMAAFLGKDIVYFLDGIDESKLPGWIIGCFSNAKRVHSLDEIVKYYKRKYNKKEK